MPLLCCRRTDGGGAYPVDVSNPDPNTVAGLSRGNIGMGMNAVCAAGIYDKLMRGNGTEMQLGCFMERQLGFTTNNKCDGARAMFQCNTGSSEGYSYIVGCAPMVTCALRRHQDHLCTCS